MPLLVNIVLDMENEDDLKYSITEVVNAESKYGETPLLIASMLKNDRNPEQRYHFLRFILEQDAQVNCYNRYTFWTPMHWAARHGDIKLMELLMKNKAKAISPDATGCFPIDYAGKFDHTQAIKCLVDYSINKFDELIAKKEEIENKKE